MKHLGDITKINWFEVEPVDVVTGGSPCQDLSVAGKRAGLAGERSGLYMEQIRCVKELRQADVQRGRTGVAIRPRFMVWENVPGAFSSGSQKGADFAAVVEEIIKVAEPGAVVHVCVPDRGWNKSGCYYAEDGSWSVAWRVHDAQFWGVPQRRKRISLVADFGGLAAPEVLFERKGLSRDFESCGTQGQRIAGSLEGGAGSAISFQERAGKPGGGKGILIQEERTGALSTLNNQSVLQLEPTPINTMVAMRHNALGEGTGFGIGEPGDPAYTVSAAHSHAVLCLQGNMIDRDVNLNYINPVRCANLVRRLTPLECERLQGYPDGWTDIGEWTDSKGKRHREADSPRYKALGNSIALPFWCWMAKRISAQCERDVTMGSLFDGIGGFPYAFEKCGGKAVWASEIEEFPIAVTKIRFPE